VAGSSLLAGVLITALSGVPGRLPGIALDSTALFLIERGGVVIAALIVLATLVGRTLNRELPTGFATPAGSVTYAETVENAVTGTETAAARLAARLNEHDAELLKHEEEVTALGRALSALTAAEKPPNSPSDTPGR
jgi:hypothetical protein